VAGVLRRICTKICGLSLYSLILVSLIVVVIVVVVIVVLVTRRLYLLQSQLLLLIAYISQVLNTVIFAVVSILFVFCVGQFLVLYAVVTREIKLFQIISAFVDVRLE